MGKPQEYLQTDLETWTRSDRYHNEHLINDDQVLDHVLETSKSLPNIAVSKAQVGLNKYHLFYIPYPLTGKILIPASEVTSSETNIRSGNSGYSTIWLARALPETGRLITLEINPQHADVALNNFKYAGLDDKIQLILGPAKESIESLQPDPPFDLIFIDADKQGNLDYFVQAKRLIREGGVIIEFLRVDNVVRYGRVADLNYHDQAVEGVRRLVEFLKTDNTVEATTLSTVGEKGYDGFIYAVKI
ncbi:hypothetical protein Clacol_006410 [Clathrus columnatus]|uniref:S-adenosyl-L-methionine-dependent methyltransferase n=1 Tax=Clathrus columnatus TaxID=1419009 RepID=A0AAV5AG74_9AGAM|nr:hypothetical protein Clacol_006410 [Clathrus columnatus]